MKRATIPTTADLSARWFECAPICGAFVVPLQAPSKWLFSSSQLVNSGPSIVSQCTLEVRCPLRTHSHDLLYPVEVLTEGPLSCSSDHALNALKLQVRHGQTSAKYRPCSWTILRVQRAFSYDGKWLLMRFSFSLHLQGVPHRWNPAWSIVSGRGRTKVPWLDQEIWWLQQLIIIIIHFI